MSKKEPNEFEHLENGITLIHVTRNNGKKYEILIDSHDYKLVSGYRWRVYKSSKRNLTWYAGTGIHKEGKYITLLMHRLLMGLKPGEECDHEDRNGLNNQRSNLRKATHTQNVYNVGRKSTNTTGYIGVQKTSSGKYSARYGQGTIHISVSDTAEEAAEARDKAVLAVAGEFARLNFEDKRAAYLAELEGVSVNGNV